MKRALAAVFLTLGACLFFYVLQHVVRSAYREWKCPERNTQYYSKKGGWDYIRMPLIRPYELVSLDRGGRWSASGAQNRSVIWADEVVVLDSMILLHAVNREDVFGDPITDPWTLCIPKSRTVIQSGWKEIRDSLMVRTGITDIAYWDALHWYDCDSLWASFRDHDSLPWLPRCE